LEGFGTPLAPSTLPETSRPSGDTRSSEFFAL